MTTRFRLARTSLLLVISIALPAFGGPLTLGTNWIVNGDAETGAGSPTGDLVPVPGWAQYGSNPMMTAIQYQSTTATGFPMFSDPGPADRGSNFFAGGPAAATSVLVQNVDVSAFGAQIDQGLISFVLSGYFGGWTTQNDYAGLLLYFVDPNSSVSTTVVLTGPGAAARSNATGLFPASTTGFIPANTRMLQFRLLSMRSEGAYNDGYADNLSFVANVAGEPSATPEPAAIALTFGGLGALALAARRRNS